VPRSAYRPTIIEGRTATAYAGFWRRALAVVIDGALVLGVIVTLTSLFGAPRRAGDSEAPLLPAPGALLAELALPAVAAVACWRMWGATPGKMIVGARIVDERTHARPSVSQCLVRLAGYVPAGLVLGLGFLAVAVDRHKQGWHDRMARTIVIATRD